MDMLFMVWNDFSFWSPRACYRYGVLTLDLDRCFSRGPQVIGARWLWRKWFIGTDYGVSVSVSAFLDGRMESGKIQGLGHRPQTVYGLQSMCHCRRLKCACM